MDAINTKQSVAKPRFRGKRYEELTSVERKFHNVISQICSPPVQADIYEDLDFEEQNMLCDFTETDIKASRDLAARKGVEYHETASVFQRLIQNGRNNMLRIAEQRGVVVEGLILDFAVSFGLLNERESRRLAKKFAGSATANPIASIMFTDNALLVNGREVCTVRPTRLSKLDHILQSFEDIGWQQSSIDFQGSYAEKQIADAVAALNKKQAHIKFRSSKSRITWKMKHVTDH